MSDERAASIVREAFAHYRGDGTIFMSAVGAFMLGRLVGWKGVRVCLAASTYRKYEDILRVRFREELPDRTDQSERVKGIVMADRLGKFWQALSGGFIPAGQGKAIKAVAS